MATLKTKDIKDWLNEEIEEANWKRIVKRKFPYKYFHGGEVKQAALNWRAFSWDEDEPTELVVDDGVEIISPRDGVGFKLPFSFYDYELSKVDNTRYRLKLKFKDFVDFSNSIPDVDDDYLQEGCAFTLEDYLEHHGVDMADLGNSFMLYLEDHEIDVEKLLLDFM